MGVLFLGTQFGNTGCFQAPACRSGRTEAARTAVYESLVTVRRHRASRCHFDTQSLRQGAAGLLGLTLVAVHSLFGLLVVRHGVRRHGPVKSARQTPRVNDALDSTAPTVPAGQNPQPLCSYVVATFNCLPLVPVLAATVQRLADQRCELCVCDGGSTDGTWQALQALPGIRLLCSAPDAGIYDAWNHALPHVRGRYVSFIGVDDEPHPGFLAAAAVLVTSADAAGGVTPGLFYGDVCLQRHGRTRRFVAPQRLRLLDEQAPVFDVYHPGCLTRVDLLQGAQTFDASFKLAGDFDYFLRQAAWVRAAGAVRLDTLQAVLKDEGMSRRPQALAVYAQELVCIEAKHGRHLGHRGTAFPWLAALARWPGLYNRCKNLSWYLRGTALADPRAGPSGLRGKPRP